jgi:hypothetical protein
VVEEIARRERLVRWNAPVFPLWSNVLFGLAFLWMAVPRTFLALTAAGGYAADEVGELLLAAGFVATTAWLLMTSRERKPYLEGPAVN